MGGVVHISSLDRVAERVVDHLRQGHHTTLVGSPGCGITTFVARLSDRIVEDGFQVIPFDLHAKGTTELARDLSAHRRTEHGQPQIVVLDHAGRLSAADYSRLVAFISENTAKTGQLCLWCGNLDARAADRELGVKLCSVPSAHVSFPIVTRDELLAVYRAIASERACSWGDAVQYLMLDLCGTDLTLVKSVTNYLHGNWNDRLYDDSIWDRVQEWLNEDETVDEYRARLMDLPESSEVALALIRFGGKPQCLRSELIEEVDDGLRRLCLDGFIIPNLLPGFYQLRNLVVRFLLDESIEPRLLFRRATNERAAALLQDAETMLRQIVASVFARIGVDDARKCLEKMQRPGGVIDEKLNRSLLSWAKENCKPELVKGLSELILNHRIEFRKANSAWATATHMMRQEKLKSDGSWHLQCVDYLTLDQLGQVVLTLIQKALPRLCDTPAEQWVRGNWREGVAKMQRLRNQAAHLRNVGFQDMEDLARTLERMRRDIIDYGGWNDSPSHFAKRSASRNGD